MKRPEFTFLLDQAKGDGRARVRAKKLRGVVSFGLLVPAPEGSNIGDDVADLLDVRHYEPPTREEQKRSWVTGGEVAPPPAVHSVEYDVDAFRRYHHLFAPGEPVVITEKLDGANARYCYCDGQMHCGSRAEWKKEFPSYDHLSEEKLVAQGCDPDKAREVIERLHSRPKKKNLWWEVLERTPSLEKFCREHPGWVVYGEIYGDVNCIKYGLPHNQFAAFDVLVAGRWLDFQDCYNLLLEYDVPFVPLFNGLYTARELATGQIPVIGIDYDFDHVCGLAEGFTLVPGAKEGVIREGVVVKPLRERHDPHVGRVCFKAVSSEYLERYRTEDLPADDPLLGT